MTEEDAGASPPTPKKFKTESEEQPVELSKDKSHPEEEEEEDPKEIEEPQMLKTASEEEPMELSKDKNHSQEESREIEEPQKLKTESEEEQMELLKDEDHSEEEESKKIEEDEDDVGPPPGWRHSPTSSPPILDMIDFPPSLTLPPTPPLPSSLTELEMEQQDSDEDDGPPPGWDNKYQLNEQAEKLAATSAISSDIQTEDVRQDAHGEEGEPRSQAHSCLPPEVAPPVEEQEHDSEDDGPPPGWDSKCQPEPKLQEIPQSDTKMEDVLQDAHNEEGQTQPTPENPSDIISDPEDSDDEGPPPGWDSKCQPEPELQKTLQSDSSDIKTNHVQQVAQNENDAQSQPQSQSRSSQAPELVPSVEEQDSEDDGPPPGWNSKCPVEPNLQTAGPTTPPSDFKIEEDKEQSHVHSSLPSPIVQSGTGHEPNNVKTIEESPQPPSRQQFIHHTAEITVPKRPTTMNNHEMGQMVCGSCRHLLSYPRGARYVECACCLVENYVLEEHEVGQVVCGSCNVLLMYPYGAPKVRCATCRAETEIGDQNRRPPLSEHKRQARQHLKRVHAG